MELDPLDFQENVTPSDKAIQIKTEIICEPEEFMEYTQNGQYLKVKPKEEPIENVFSDYELSGRLVSDSIDCVNQSTTANGTDFVAYQDLIQPKTEDNTNIPYTFEDRPMPSNESALLQDNNPTFNYFNTNQNAPPFGVSLNKIKTEIFEMEFKCKDCPETFTKKSLLNLHNKAIHLGIKVYSCDQCSKTFARDRSLIAHKQTHIGETPFKCDNCPVGFTKQTQLVNHQKQVHGIWMLACTQCPRTFTQVATFNHHKMAHTTERTHKCIECECAFKHHSSLVAHQKSVHIETPYVCDECPRTFGFASHLKRHKSTHVADKPFQCDKCPSAFRMRSTLVGHQREVHFGLKKYQCDVCMKKFKRNESLKDHKLTHTEHTPYKCDNCPTVAFSKHSQLMYHQREVHGIWSLQCAECPRTFSHISTLNHHKLSHTKERTYKCIECECAFKHRSTLVAHQKSVHIEVTPFACDECPQMFEFASQLQRHKSEHAADKTLIVICDKSSSEFQEVSAVQVGYQGEESDTLNEQKLQTNPSFKCNNCPAVAFSKYSHFARHQREVHGSGLLKCAECPRTFLHVSTLNHHKLTHTKERTYKCPNCTSAFKHKSSLMSHQRSVHVGFGPYACDECPRIFSMQSKYRRHKSLHEVLKESAAMKCEGAPM